MIFPVKSIGGIDWGWGGQIESLVIAVFVLSIGLAVAVPIGLRSLFVYRWRDRRSVSEEEFIRFEQLLMRVALSSTFGSLIAYALDFPGFYLSGIFLAALYSAYYFYPSQRRLTFEKRIFRVR